MYLSMYLVLTYVFDYLEAYIFHDYLFKVCILIKVD